MMNAKILRLFIVLLISAGAVGVQECKSVELQKVSITPATSNLQSAVSEGEKLESSKKTTDNKSAGIKSETVLRRKESERISVFRGIYLSTDVFGYIYPLFVKDKYYSSELSATLNLADRFFPTMEMGLGYTDMESQLYSIRYRTRAPYYRIGMDYNMQYGADKPGYIYLGARAGYTSFTYSVEAPPLVDPVWGDETPVRFSDVPSRAVWGEVVGGLRAEIVKNVYMGWSLRYKYPFYRSAASNGGPWYVPGLGTGKKGVLGATYTIGYYLNFSKRR